MKGQVVPSNTPPIYCPMAPTHPPYPSKGIRTPSQHRPNALRALFRSHSIICLPFAHRLFASPPYQKAVRFFPLRSSFFTRIYPPNGVPLPMLRPKMCSDLPEFLYIIRCNCTKLLLRKGKFPSKKTTKRVFTPFKALVCRRPLFCKSSLQVQLQAQSSKIGIISSFCHPSKSPSKTILTPSQHRPDTIQKPSIPSPLKL